MKHLWNGEGPLGNPPRDYATYDNAVKAAKKVIQDDWPIHVIIAATPKGRFFPVALGMKAFDYGLHFKMCVAG